MVRRANGFGRLESQRPPNVRFSGAYLIPEGQDGDSPPAEGDEGSDGENYLTPIAAKDRLSRKLSAAQTDDLSQLEVLDTKTIMRTLQGRYEAGNLQVSGHVLIVVAPWNYFVFNLYLSMTKNDQYDHYTCF